MIKQVTYGYDASPGPGASWWFIPLGDLQRLVRNQGFIPKELFSVSSQTLQKIVQDMLVVFKDDLKVENPPSMMQVEHLNRAM